MKKKPAEERFLQSMQPFSGLEPYGRYAVVHPSGLKLFYYEVGSEHQPAVVLIHGLGDEADTWRHLIHPLSDRWRVIALDLPGFGRSDKPDAVYDVAFMKNAILGLMDELGISRAVLIGHSLGGMLAHGIALEHPEKVSGLVALSGSLLLQPQSMNPQMLLFLIPAVGEWLYNNLRKDPQAAYDTLRLYYENLDGLPAPDREFLFLRVNQRVWSDDQRRAYFSTLRRLAAKAVRPERGLSERLAGCTLPTLALWGEKDRVYSPTSGMKLQKLQPNTRFFLLPALGHNAHQEDPGVLLQHILMDERLD